MKTRRKMRSARKLRRIQAITILLWVLALFVFWVVRSLHTMTVDPLDITTYDSEFYVTQVIYLAVWLVGLIFVLVIETLILGKRKPDSVSAFDAGQGTRSYEPHLGVTPSRIDISR